MHNKEYAISVLNSHIDKAVALIKTLKKSHQKLETRNQVLQSENDIYKKEIQKYEIKLKGHEVNLGKLEALLDEAQKEQELLEYSILNAINGLGKADSSLTPTQDELQDMETQDKQRQNSDIQTIDKNQDDLIDTQITQALKEEHEDSIAQGIINEEDLQTESDITETLVDDELDIIETQENTKNSQTAGIF